MPRLKQSFRNGTEQPQFINLEVSTARFRLEPGQSLFLSYDSDDVVDEHGSALNIEVIADGRSVEFVVWTNESEMFFADGRPAPCDYGV